MKKIISILLTVCFIVNLSSITFATNDDNFIHTYGEDYKNNIIKIEKEKDYILEFSSENSYDELVKYSKDKKIKIKSTNKKLKIAKIKSTEGEAKQLMNKSFIKNLEIDHKVKMIEANDSLLKDDSIFYNIDSDYNGKNIKIAIFDTGINEKELEVKLNESMNFTNEDIIDKNGHGTRIANLVSTLADEVALINVKVLDEEGNGYYSDIIEGIEWSIENDVDIINMSFSSEFKSSILEKVIKRATEKGIIIVGSAGNDGNESRVEYPAAYKDVIAVGAVTDKGEITNFTPVNSRVDIYAPGYSLENSEIQGTSYSSAYISASIAILLSSSKIDSEDAVDLIYMTQSPIVSDAEINACGYINLSRALNNIDNYLETIKKLKDDSKNNSKDLKDKFYEKIINQENNTVQTKDSLDSPVKIYTDIDYNYGINFQGDNDYFKFTVPVSGRYRIYTTGDTDTYGYLYDMTYSIIDKNNDSGEGRNFEIERLLTGGRSYIVRVKGDSSSTVGNYVLRVESPDGANIDGDEYEPNDSFTFAKDIDKQCILNANIHDENDEDYYKFEITYVSDVQIQLYNIPANCNYNIKLYTEDYEQIDSSTNSSNDYEEMENRLVPGVYYIRIYPYDKIPSEDNYGLQIDTDKEGWVSSEGGTWVATECFEDTSSVGQVRVTKVVYLQGNETAILSAIIGNYDMFSDMISSYGTGTTASWIANIAEVTYNAASTFIGAATTVVYNALGNIDELSLDKAILEGNGRVKITFGYMTTIAPPYYANFINYAPWDSENIYHEEYYDGNFEYGPIDVYDLEFPLP